MARLKAAGFTEEAINREIDAINEGLRVKHEAALVNKQAQISELRELVEHNNRVIAERNRELQVLQEQMWKRSVLFKLGGFLGVILGGGSLRSPKNEISDLAQNVQTLREESQSAKAQLKQLQKEYEEAVAKGAGAINKAFGSRTFGSETRDMSWAAIFSGSLSAPGEIILLEVEAA